MQANLQSSNEIKEIFKAHETFLLTTASPDGDSVGSLLALCAGLTGQGKNARVYFPEPVPENLAFLPGFDRVTYSLPAERVEVLVVVDTGSSKLLFDGDRGLWKKIAGTILNLDHHPDNDRFGDLNIVTPQAAATGEIIYQIFVQLGWGIDKKIADCLLTALMADTGIFRYPNVTPRTLSIASELLEKKGDLGLIARKLYSSRSLPYVKLLSRMYGNLKFEREGELAWSVLSKEDFEGCGASDDEADKMVEELDVLKDVKVYALLRQQKDGVIKVGLRSRENFPVNQVAAQFGGGGHRQAAGCKLSGQLKEAEKKIVESLRSLFP